MTEVFLTLEGPIRRLDLIINTSKTKYMFVGQEAREGERIQIGTYSFAKVNKFDYLRYQVNTDEETYKTW